MHPGDLFCLVRMGKGLVEPFISEGVPYASALGLTSCRGWSPDDFNYHCAVALLRGERSLMALRNGPHRLSKLDVMIQWGAELLVFGVSLIVSYTWTLDFA